MTINIGTGPDSWGIATGNLPGQIPWAQYLDEAAEAGYEWTELGPYGYLPTEPETLKRELDSRGLQVTANAIMSGHLDDPSNWNQLEVVVRRFAALGAAIDAKYFFLFDTVSFDPVSGRQIAPSNLDETGWNHLVNTINKVADIIHHDFGLKMTVHPHVDTHIQYEDQIEALLQQTDPKRVSLLLDTGHHAYAGGDTINFIRKHHNRIAYLHLKNVNKDILKKVNDQKLTTSEATKLGLFCELDQGIVDFVSVLNVLNEVKYEGWATVEQDMFKPNHNVPLPIAKRTREYLKQIGFG